MWSVSEFSGSSPLTVNLAALPKGFTPIQSIVVFDQLLHVGTWGGEPRLAPMRPTRNGAVFRPDFLTPLGSTSQLEIAAQDVAPYNSENIVFTLEVPGNCENPNTIYVDVVDRSSDRRSRITLKRSDA